MTKSDGLLAAGAIVLTVVLVGCGVGNDGAATDAAPAHEPETEATAVVPERVADLANTQDALFAFARALLDRIEADDLEGLMALRVSEAEFYWLVWPKLPSSQPERNLSWDYVWRDLDQKSRNSARRTIERQAGRRYELMRIEFEDETTDYGTYLVHRDARVVVQNEAGAILRLDLFGSVIEMNGRFKAFSLVTD